MEAKEKTYLYQISVGEHFILQGTEYVREGKDVEEENNIYCRNIKDGGTGLLAKEKEVRRMPPVEKTA